MRRRGCWIFLVCGWLAVSCASRVSSAIGLEDVGLGDVGREEVEREDVEREDVEREDVEREDVEREDVEREEVEREGGGARSRSPDLAGRPYRGFKVFTYVAKGGTAVTLGDRLFYFDGLGTDYLSELRDSVFLGGVFPALLAGVGRQGLGYLLYDWPVTGLGGFRVPALSLAVSLVMTGAMAYAMEMPSRCIGFTWRAGGRYSIPALLGWLSLSDILQAVGLPVHRYHFYWALLGLGGLDAALRALRQLGGGVTTGVVPVYVTGPAASRLMIKAIFSGEEHKESGYELRWLFTLDRNNKDAYHQLADTMEAMQLDAIRLLPSSWDGHLLNVVFDDHLRGERVTLSLRDEDRASEDVPWLFAAIQHKRERASISRVKSALSPRVIEEVAGVLKLYNNQVRTEALDEGRRLHEGAVYGGAPADPEDPAGEDGEDREDMHSLGLETSSLKSVGVGHYVYTSTSPFLQSGFSQVDHQHEYSDFVWETGVAKRQVIVRWQDGLWPGLSLNGAGLAGLAGLAEGVASGPEQWWVPEWVTRLLLAELAVRGQRAGKQLGIWGVDLLAGGLGIKERTDIVLDHLSRGTLNQFREERRMQELVEAGRQEHNRERRADRGLANRMGRVFQGWDAAFFGGHRAGIPAERVEIELLQQLEAYSERAGREVEAAPRCIVCFENGDDLRAMPGCGNPICMGCLVQWGRTLAGERRIALQAQGEAVRGLPPLFYVDCPVRCNAPVPARVLQWNARR